jgi:hypothetical protein
MSDSELARRAVLDSAGEDDWGLWEILAGVRSALPGRDEAEWRTLADGAVRSLAGEGLVELRRGRALHNERAQPVSLDQLDERRAWEPAGDEPSYLTLHITPGGKEAYYAMLREPGPTPDRET